MAWVENQDAQGDQNLPILYDPQTSGGLLIALPADKADAYIDEMHQRGHEATSRIGQLRKTEKTKEERRLIITNAQLENVIGEEKAIIPKENPIELSLEAEKKRSTELQNLNACCANPPKLEEPSPCCDNPPTFDEDTHGALLATSHEPQDALPLFMDFMHKTGESGALDLRAKKMLWIALSVGFRCEPCLETHLRGAVEMGISKEEIEEASNIGIAFGGCSAMLLYRAVCKRLKI